MKENDKTEFDWQGCAVCSKHVGFSEKDVYPIIVCSEECAEEYHKFEVKNC